MPSFTIAIIPKHNNHTTATQNTTSSIVQNELHTTSNVVQNEIQKPSKNIFESSTVNSTDSTVVYAYVENSDKLIVSAFRPEK